MKKRLFGLCLCLLAGAAVFSGGVNYDMMRQAAPKEVTNMATIPDDTYEAAVILGAGVQHNYPMPLLKERLDGGIALYERQKVKKLILSGVNEAGANQPVVMAAYVTAAGIDRRALISDEAGTITYESMRRAHDVYGYRRVIAVTQAYHMARAIYLADHLGLDVIGYVPPGVRYHDQWIWDLREVPARVKAWLMIHFFGR